MEIERPELSMLMAIATVMIALGLLTAACVNVDDGGTLADRLAYSEDLPSETAAASPFDEDDSELPRELCASAVAVSDAESSLRASATGSFTVQEALRGEWRLSVLELADHAEQLPDEALQADLMRIVELSPAGAIDPPDDSFVDAMEELRQRVDQQLLTYCGDRAFTALGPSVGGPANA